MKADFLGKRLLVITAHPDDESYAAAGTIYKNRQRGGRTFIVCATFGEKGKSHLKKPVSDRQMKNIRGKELLAASKFLRAEKLFALGMPDASLRFHESAIFAKCLAIAEKTKPDFILSFGDDGISGHTDHITVGRAARRVAKKLKLPFAAFALPPRFAQNAPVWLKTRRKHGHYGHPIGFLRPNIKISIDGKIKKRALRFHKSQMDSRAAFAGFPKYAVQALFRAEYFCAYRSLITASACSDR